MKQLVTIIRAEADKELTKRNGGTYRGAGLVYSVGGEVRPEKGIHASVLQSRPDLFQKIKDLEGKQNVDVALHMVKNDNGFWDLLDILPPEQAGGASTGSSGGFAGKRSESNMRSNHGTKNVADTARIARQTALQSAVAVTDNAEAALKVAGDFATFILKPLGVDNEGNELSTQTTEAATSTDTTPTKESEETPF